MDASLADIAAVTRDENGFGGNGLWLFAILALMNGGFGGWGNGRYNGFDNYTSAQTQEILFGQQFQGLDNKIDRIGNGIADATFALNNSILGAQANLGGAINSEGRALQMQMAEGFCATQNAVHQEGEMTRALIQQNKIEGLRDRVAQLEMQNAMCGVVKYPNASTYYAGNNPFCGNGGCNFGCGCGA